MKRNNFVKVSSFLTALLVVAFVGIDLHASPGKPDQSTVKPTFEEVHAVPLPKTEFGYRGCMGDMIELKDGTLLMAYTKADRDIVAIKSKDKGKTWGDEFVLVPGPKPELPGRPYYCHPSFLRLDNGDIILSYIYIGEATPRFSTNYYRRSVDDGKTWGDQLIMTPYPGYLLVHNDKLVQLSSGRLITPVECEIGEEGNDHRGYISFVFYSDDRGKSWRLSENKVNVLPVEAQEPHVVELKDGRLMMLMRTYSGYIVRSYSSDKGTTWSKGEPIENLKLANNSSALCVERIPSTGDLLLLRCSGEGADEPRRRTPFVSVISKDDGKTWENERVIAGDPDDDYGYPCLMFLGDKAIIAYHKRDGIYVGRFDINWFYGK